VVHSISAAQAATILGKTVEHVHRLMALGRLPKHGPPNTFWQLRLSGVERLRDRGEPISLKEAARLLRCATDGIRKLIADGKLTAVPGSRRPVYVLEVQALAAALDLPPRSRFSSASVARGPRQHREAARMLGRSISRFRLLAAECRIPAQRDENGNYWYKPDQLEMMRRTGLVAEPTTAAKRSTPLRLPLRSTAWTASPASARQTPPRLSTSPAPQAPGTSQPNLIIRLQLPDSCEASTLALECQRRLKADPFVAVESGAPISEHHLSLQAPPRDAGSCIFLQLPGVRPHIRHHDMRSSRLCYPLTVTGL
jgi:hypothetical protein